MTYPPIRLEGLLSELEKDLLSMTSRNLRIVSIGLKSSLRWLSIWESTTQRPMPFTVCPLMKLGQRRQVRNEDLCIELDYYNEEYDEEREMEPRLTHMGEATPVLHTGSLRVQRHK
ncbi:hypothetical protein Tco_1361919 [Tanacetum coccineum]